MKPKNEGMVVCIPEIVGKRNGCELYPESYTNEYGLYTVICFVNCASPSFFRQSVLGL